LEAVEMKSWILWGGIAIVALLVVVVVSSGGEALSGSGVVYKSSTCNCCGVWTRYAEGAGLDLTVIETENVDEKKDQYGIPAELRSCHTTEVEGYFIEGHIPEEAIAKLLEERPDIAGIAMPGMPSGSPGMPGPKQGPFIIFAVDHDGSYKEFMRI